MTEKHDILNLEDVKLLVDSFYSKARENKLLGPVFNKKIGDHWSEHLEKMVRFWQTLLLGEHTYSGNPLLHHLHLPISGEHFSEWLRMFHETIDTYFEGEKAQEAHLRAEKISLVMQTKLSQLDAG
jgi:hemoglobin